MGNRSEGNALDETATKNVKQETHKESSSSMSFNWVDLTRFSKEDSESMSKEFGAKFKDQLKKNNLEQIWKDKFWDAFLNRIVLQEKREWFNSRVDESTRRKDFVITDSDSSTMKKVKKANRTSYLSENYKSEYDNMVTLISSRLISNDDDEKQWQEDFFMKFIRTVQVYTNPEKFYEEYFDWPSEITIDHVKENKLPWHLQWIVDDGRINGISDTDLLNKIQGVQKSLGNKLMVRIIISSLPKVDKGSFLGGIKVLVASRITPLGLNHESLQVGPYLIHWTDSNLVTVHKVGDHKNVVALVYPDTKFFLDIQDKEHVMKLCNAIIDYNGRMYDQYSNNCQKFVDVALESIGCQRKWIKNGPMEKFLSHVAKLDCTANKMTFWDLKGKEHSFKNYTDFNNFCTRDEDIQELLKKKVLYASEEYTDKAEFLQVLKAIERGFQIQLPDKEKRHPDSLLFPIPTYENIGNITSLPGVTISIV